MKKIENIKAKLKAVKKAFKFIKVFIVLALIASTLLSIIWAMYLRNELIEKDHPLEITEVHIKEKLSDISELATQEFTYTNQSDVSDATEIIGTNIEIPGTTNTINVTYSGVIKVGYDIEKITYQNIDNTIIFKIPEPYVTDNYLIYDELVIKEENNILNPISSEDIMELFKDIESKELKTAENKGIYKEAENKLKEIITSFFSEYTVKFL